MFSTLHIIVMCIVFPLIAVGTYYSLKLSFEKVLRIMLAIGFVSEFTKIFTYILMNEDKLGGYLPKTDLPFHLCSIQILFLIVLVLSKNDNTKQIIRSFMLPTCLIGGFAAILIPTSSSISELNVLTFQYFGYHAAIMILALRMYIGKDVTFTIRDYGTCLVMLFATMFAAVYINSILYSGVSDENFFYTVTDGEHTGLIQLANVNFMYMVGPPVKGLPFLNEKHGWAVYVAHYLCLCLFGITGIYIRPIINYFKERKAARAEGKNENNA